MHVIEHLVIPGRHHVLTNFQHQYLLSLFDSKIVTDVRGNQLQLSESPNVIWAVTSANHSNTKRNPIPGNRREQAIEAFAATLPANGFSYPINDLGYTPRFADFVLKEIEVQSRGQFRLSPENTAIICSTPSVIAMYEKLGYKILPAELADIEKGTFSETTPWECVQAIITAGPSWQNDETYRTKVHVASRHILEKYRLGDLIVELHNDPLLGDEGDITDTRDYETYRQAFEDGAKRKYEVIRPYVKNGRIVDIGCATGEIIKLMGEDTKLGEADLYGIEASQKLYKICEQRRQDGHFKNENTFFYQRNIMTDIIFPNNSVDTTTTFSLTHEIESYLGRDALYEFLKRLYDQTTPGGVFINSDVVGPDNKDQVVIMKLSDQDGHTESWQDIQDTPKVSTEHLQNLSTLGRFRRFTQDFRTEYSQPIAFRQADELGTQYIELRLADASDFLSKKDYCDSWYSEMHETFCYWSFSDWQHAIESVGFSLHEASHAYQNDWIIENRYRPTSELYISKDGNLETINFPVTNMLLIAEKI